jgi:hypothetical protein
MMKCGEEVDLVGLEFGKRPPEIDGGAAPAESQYLVLLFFG